MCRCLRRSAIEVPHCRADFTILTVVKNPSKWTKKGGFLGDASRERTALRTKKGGDGKR